MFLTIKKAAQDKIIVEEGNKLPIVYDGITEMVADLFFEKINREFSGTELTVNIEFTFNPPQSSNQ